MLGLVGKKIGMTQVFDDTGKIIPVTLLKVDTHYVVGQRTIEKDGYVATIVGCGDLKPKKVTKPYAGQFPEGIKPSKVLFELRDFDKGCEVGEAINVDLFEGIEYVDVKARSKGKGYQGVMKLHGFAGGRKTHGSKFHRAHGSTGMAAWPSRVMKGTKMPGRMGYDFNTTQNLKLVRIDKEQNVILVKGAVPGRKNTSVLITKAKKR